MEQSFQMKRRSDLFFDVDLLSLRWLELLQKLCLELGWWHWLLLLLHVELRSHEIPEWMSRGEVSRVRRTNEWKDLRSGMDDSRQGLLLVTYLNCWNWIPFRIAFTYVM